MNKKTTIGLFVFIGVIIITGILFKPIKIYIESKQIIDEIENQTGDIFTGNTVQPTTGNIIDIISGTIATGNQEIGTIFSNFDIYSSYIQSGKYRKFSPPPQYIELLGTYAERSAELNKYLKNNNFYFRLNNKINTGYLYIKTKQPVKSDSDIFLYRHNSNIGGYKVSGKIIKELNLIKGSQQEFLFLLDSIAIRKYFDGHFLAYNWKNELNNTSELHFIGGYVVDFNGNQIKEITIAWE